VPLKRHSGNLWKSTEESELGRGPREEHGPVGEDWGHNGVEIEFGRRG